MVENGAMCFKPQDTIFPNKLLRFLKNVETSRGLQDVYSKNVSQVLMLIIFSLRVPNSDPK